jgi:hypothetical protein
MSFWRRLLERLQAIRLELESWLHPVDPTSTVDFSIADTTLAAKLAKSLSRNSILDYSALRGAG